MLASLQETSLAPWQGGLLTALVLAAAGGLAWARVGDAAIRRLLWLTSGVLLAACAAVGLADIRLLSAATRENNVIETLTAASLLAAAVVAFASAVRLHRQGRPSPVAMTLAAGFAWAFWRELEYGGDLVGRQFYFTRNVFHLRSFYDVSFFEQVRRDMRIPYGPAALHVIHLGFTALGVAVFCLLGWYWRRHRTAGAAELRGFLRAFYCRLYLAGTGLYVAAEILGGTLRRLPCWMPAAFGWFQGCLFHRIVEETTECWGAVAILLSAVALWQSTRAAAGGDPCSPTR